MIPYADLELALNRYKARLAGHAAAPEAEEADVDVSMSTPAPVDASEISGVVVVSEEAYEGAEPEQVPAEGEGTGEIDPTQIVE